MKPSEDLTQMIAPELGNLLSIFLEDFYSLKEDFPASYQELLKEYGVAYREALEKFRKIKSPLTNTDFFELIHKHSALLAYFESISVESASKEEKELLGKISRVLNETRELLIFFKNLAEGSVRATLIKAVDFVNGIPWEIHDFKLSVLISTEIKDKAIFIPTDGLQTALDGVITNAIHATQDCLNPEVTVKATIEENKLVIRIIDNGSGIPPENHKKIFYRGFTTKAAKGGTGLGLPCARYAMEVIEGLVELESSKTGNTVFKVSVPLAQKSKLSVNDFELTIQDSTSTFLLEASDVTKAIFLKVVCGIDFPKELLYGLDEWSYIYNNLHSVSENIDVSLIRFMNDVVHHYISIGTSRTFTIEYKGIEMLENWHWLKSFLDLISPDHFQELFDEVDPLSLTEINQNTPEAYDKYAVSFEITLK